VVTASNRTQDARAGDVAGDKEEFGQAIRLNIAGFVLVMTFFEG
jgi:hypothetical protein